MSFAATGGAPLPDGDVLVWDLEVPRDAVAAVAALCDGYDHRIQLRSKWLGGSGSFAAWVAPAFADDAGALFTYIARRFGVTVAGPRPFAAADLAAGMHLGSSAGPAS